MGLAGKHMNAMRAIQEHWSISLKNILSDLDEKYKYRSKQYKFQTKAHEQQWYLDEELVDHLLENQVTVFDEDKVIEY
ncbi:hypothetical protein ACQKM9_21580, partial [Viridibacillus sp. NPDC093762]|uniref:hypothetical protein n=1 Tax=Viridibacillus sp. NPDC093762 TaxID=3390720 RepID=UPI003CFFA85C